MISLAACSAHGVTIRPARVRTFLVVNVGHALPDRVTRGAGRDINI